jgi:protein TonB
VDFLKVILVIFAALVVHVLVGLFGGYLFSHEEQQASKRDVEIVTESVEKENEEKPEEQQPQDEIKEQDEAPPDPESVASSVEAPSSSDDAPALDAASLSAIEAALNGDASAAGGDFGGAQASLQGGGRIGGTGKPGSGGGGGDDEFSGAFSMSEIDQRPRAVYQVAAPYPAGMRSQKAEGTVTLIFIVDEAGRVVNPRIERSSHPEFEAPALEALRQWKFEPAVKAGKRVSCRMRVPMRFQPR